MNKADNRASHPLDPPTYTVPSFCEAHGISRGFLYQLWSEGRGPRRTKLGRRTFVTREAAAIWRARMEEETARLEGDAAARL
jgi:predicted DNA-binding transcriptional regulator AlpA